MMNTKNNKARVAVAVLVLLGMLVLFFLAFAINQSYYTGIFGTAASAQPVDIFEPVKTVAAIYVKFDGINGESEDRDHLDWIDVLSYSQGQYIPDSSATRAGASRESSVFEEIILRKELDKASPNLAQAVCLGKVFPKVDIHVTRELSDGARITYYVYELKNVIVSRYHIGCSRDDEIPAERISLNFEQVKVTYTKFDLNGRSESIMEYSWDIARNQPQ
jgi:type VI secretion system secreted protein Hcp